MEIVGEIFQKIYDPSLASDLPAWSSFGALVAAQDSPPEVTSRTTQRRSDPKKEKLGDRSAASSASAPTPDLQCIPNAPASPRQLSVTAPSGAHEQILPSDRKFKREYAQQAVRTSRCDLIIAVFRCFLKCAPLAILLVLVMKWDY
jgi:hypothetical protein